MVKIRLARRGRKKLALFDVVVANATAPRDGRFIEKLGTYNPNTIPATIVLDENRALKWLMDGAQPTDTTRAILSYRGVMFKKHLQVGVNKGAITQEAADGKFNLWKEGKESKISGRVDNLAKAKVDAAKARLDAETKVNEARVAAQQAKIAAEIAAANPAPAEESAEETLEIVSEAVENSVAQVEEVVEASIAEETPATEAISESSVSEEVVVAEQASESPADEETKTEA